MREKSIRKQQVLGDSSVVIFVKLNTLLKHYFQLSFISFSFVAFLKCIFHFLFCSLDEDVDEDVMYFIITGIVDVIVTRDM